MAEASILKDIKASLATHARSATFACGGSIPIKVCTKTGGVTTSTSPIQVRFGKNGLGSTLNIPGSDASSKEFKDLINVSLPATFARAGEEVLDEDYRKAGKLDRGHFTTDFCPYETGIVDTLTQILLPQTSQSKHVRSIRVCSYPSSQFDALANFIRLSCTSSTSTALPAANLSRMSTLHAVRNNLVAW